MSRMKIAVLEPERDKCEELVMEAINALLGLPIVTEVEKVQDPGKIKKYGVPETPGLVINDKVKVFGRAPKREEIKQWLQEEYRLARAG